MLNYLKCRQLIPGKVPWTMHLMFIEYTQNLSLSLSLSLSISEVEGSSSRLCDPRNREIGFVSSAFLFRACRACRACGRGEAAWAHVDRCPYRWASRVLGWTCRLRVFEQ